jgi:phosphoribosyl-ATP pyrophosphohydrolase/phosphoribosyl-AMP cyclohydrolase
VKLRVIFCILKYKNDCDNDALLIKVKPAGPVCHTALNLMLSEETAKGFIYRLEEIIEQRISDDCRRFIYK